MSYDGTDMLSTGHPEDTVRTHASSLDKLHRLRCSAEAVTEHRARVGDDVGADRGRDSIVALIDGFEALLALDRLEVLLRRSVEITLSLNDDGDRVILTVVSPECEQKYAAETIRHALIAETTAAAAQK